MRCGSRAPADRGASAGHPERLQPFVVRQQAADRRYLAHFDGVAIQSGENPVKSRCVTTVQQNLPAVEVPQVRLSADVPAEPLQVSLDYRAPLLKARPRQMGRQLAVQSPGAPLGAGEIR